MVKYLERVKGKFKKDNDKMKYPKSKPTRQNDLKLRPIKKMNKKGQEFMLGLMILVMAIIVFIATIPALKSIMDTTRQSNYLNCDGYVYITAENPLSYNDSLEEETLACVIMDLNLPYLILGVLVVSITLLMRGKLISREEPSYGGYGAQGY